MTEIIEPLETSRQFQLNRRVALSDTDHTGRLRLDACARYLQDVAAFDAIDADISNVGNWVLRQNNIFVSALPAYGEPINSRTYLTGSGRAWVERTSVISNASTGERQICAKALWVLTHATSGAPISVPEHLYAVYGPLATSHKVSIRDVKRPSLPHGASVLDWQIRYSDQDILAHLNNATYLEALEEVLHREDIRITSDQKLTCQVSFWESTTYDDPSDTYFSTTKEDGAVTVGVFFAKNGLVRASINLKLDC